MSAKSDSDLKSRATQSKSWCKECIILGGVSMKENESELGILQEECRLGVNALCKRDEYEVEIHILASSRVRDLLVY
jgi:hypothetical protein